MSSDLAATDPSAIGCAAQQKCLLADAYGFDLDSFELSDERKFGSKPANMRSSRCPGFSIKNTLNGRHSC
jgi:hypothetical protein